MKKVFATLGAGILVPFLSFAQSKILLTPDMLTNLSTKGDANLLIDEQQLAGDPKNGTGFSPTTTFFGGYNGMYYPIRVIIDLKSTYQLTDIYLFDAHNADSLKIYTGTPFNWSLNNTVYLGSWQTWQSFTLNQNTRYLLLEFPSTQANISEILLYGNSLASKQPIPQPTPHTLPLMEDFIGANALHDQPIDKLKCIGSIREYHPWQWDEGNDNRNYTGYPFNQFAWSPSWVSGTNWGWDFDATYSQFHASGFDLSPCLQQTAPYLLGNSTNIEQKPIVAGRNALDPQSYKEHARYLYQFAARYGSTTIPQSGLMLRPGQPNSSGLGLIKYIENWNEGDKWWRGREGYLSPYEMAAMCSADYDGHEGALGSKYGAKNADPNIRFAMGGLATLSLEYIKAMKMWSDHNRTTGFPSDVLNFHHYSNSSGGQDAEMMNGISPEDDSLKYKLKEIVEYRNLYLPGKEIWLSEFGYDTNPNSPQGAKAIGQNDIYEVQAQWLVRSYLEIAAAGVDRAHVYFFADLNAKDPNKFNSSGLVNEKWNNYQPKISWYYIYAMKKALTGYQFDSEIPSNDPEVNIYKFTNTSTSTSIYAAWCNTSKDKHIPNFQINTFNAQGATLLSLSTTDTTAQESQLAMDANGFTYVNLSERPVFIRTVSSNSTECLTVNTKKNITLYLDENGSADIDADDINNGTKSNCGTVNLNISKSHFDCSDITSGEYQEIVSDKSWTRSFIKNITSAMSFPWSGVNGNLPASFTFTLPIETGQPKSYYSIDAVQGSDVIKADNFVTFYKKTFSLTKSDVSFFFEMTADDDMEVYLNGTLIAREQSHDGSSATLPPHSFVSNPSLFPAKTNGVYQSFDYTASNAEQLLVSGENEIVVAIRNKNGNDNGGFSFYMGIGNPLATGHKVTLTATDNITSEVDTQSTHVQVLDIFPPSFQLQSAPSAYIMDNGYASFDLYDLASSVSDNCSLKSVTYSPDSIHFNNLVNQSTLDIVSDNTWRKSSVTSMENTYTIPWIGITNLPDSTTYQLPVTLGQPYKYVGIHQISGTKVISTGSHTTFFKKTFDLNIGSIDECQIELTVDDDVEIYINGKLIAREGDFSPLNSIAPAHRLRFTSKSIQNGYQFGDSFDTITTHNPISLLNPNGSNEIILAVRNGGNNNVGGFSFKLSIPIKQKFHYPATLVATDIYDNISTAYTLVQIKDTIAPTVVASSPSLIPSVSGMLSLSPNMFDNGSYDNTSIKSMSVFPSAVPCNNAQAAYLTVTDLFDNTTTTAIPLSIVSSLCPSGSGGKKSSSAGTPSPENEEVASEQWTVSAYPMPARDHVTMDMSYVLAKQDITIEVWDLSGRKVLARSFTPDFPGYYSHQLDVSALAAGEYILKLWHNDQRKIVPLMIN